MEQNLPGPLKEQIESLKSNSQVILQRHGKTVANEAYEQIKNHSDMEEMAAWILDPNMRDPKLSQTGVEQ